MLLHLTVFILESIKELGHTPCVQGLYTVLRPYRLALKSPSLYGPSGSQYIMLALRERKRMNEYTLFYKGGEVDTGSFYILPSSKRERDQVVMPFETDMLTFVQPKHHTHTHTYSHTHTYTHSHTCLLYTSPSPRDQLSSRMPSSA